MKIRSNENENVDKDSVQFSDHNQEFYNFFEARKLLCDELSGLKPVKLNNDKIILIKRHNFIKGLERLESFVSDYIYNIKDSDKVSEIESKFRELLVNFRSNEDYHFLSAKDKDGELSNSSKVKYNLLYFHYLRGCFEISHLISVYLQNSLNISTGELVKDIKFANNKGFFNNLSIYRQEINMSMSSVNLKNIFANHKKMLGYFFTYKFLITSDGCKTIHELNKYILEIITDEDVLRLIQKYHDSNISKSDCVKCDELVENLKVSLKEIYQIINLELSYRNILPKSIVKVMRDETSI